MTRYERIATAAVDRYLRDCEAPAIVRLGKVEEVAELAASAAGKLRPLRKGMYGYLSLLPDGTRVGVIDYQFVVLNPFCKFLTPDDFSERSRTALMSVAGGGLTRYQRAARTRAQAYLKSHRSEAAIPLYRISYIADQAAADAGKQGELFNSLYDYPDILPQGCQTGWFDSLLSAVNPWSDADLPERTQVVAGPFDAAVDMGPGSPPMLPDTPVRAPGG